MKITKINLKMEFQKIGLEELGEITETRINRQLKYEIYNKEKLGLGSDLPVK